MDAAFSGESRGNRYLASQVSLPARLSRGRALVQAGRDRSDVKVERLSPVHCHIATVTAAAAPPGTGAADGTAEAAAAGEAAGKPPARPRAHQAALTPEKPHPCGIVPAENRAPRPRTRPGGHEMV